MKDPMSADRLTRTPAHEEAKAQNLEETRVEVTQVWDDIAQNPDYLTDLSEQQVVFCAGGALTLHFGDAESPIWQGMLETMEDDTVIVAGVEFTRKELEAVGSFYRWMHAEPNNFSFHCIDERLEGDEDHLHDEVHVGCGACAAVGAATGLENVEDMLLELSGDGVKQDIYADMPDHVSMVVLVDLHGADVVLGEKRQELKDKKALPFNVSIPLAKVGEYVVATDKPYQELVYGLVKWSAKIAQNIIKGGHNELQPLAKDMLLVVDTRDLPEELDELQRVVFGALEQELAVPEDQVLVL